MYMIVPVKSYANIVNLGNIEHIIEIEMQDTTISFDKRKSHNINTNGIWLELDGKTYYFKTIKTMTHLINELLGVKITEYFGLSSVHYRIGKGLYNGKVIYGLLSKYERKQGYQYQNLEDLIFSEDSLITEPYDYRDLSFLKVLENTYSGSPLPNQLKTVLIRDLVTNEQDRKMSEIHIRANNHILELDKLFDYEIEWNLIAEETETDLEEINMTQDDIHISYKIPGLLAWNEKELSYIQNDPIFQKQLSHFMEMEIVGMLEQVEIENSLMLSQMDYDYYSLYSEIMKSKIKSMGFLK